VFRSCRRRLHAKAKAEADYRFYAAAGIKGGDEAVRNGAAQDDLFAALLYQHPRGKIVAASAVAPVRLGLG
jgi:hypothetical protein